MSGVKQPPQPPEAKSHALAPANAPQKPPLTNRWVIPYIDQPPGFWDQVEAEFGDYVAEVYFPLPGGGIGTGRPPQPQKFLNDFLRKSPLPMGALINPLTLPEPVEAVAPGVIEVLRRLRDEFGLAGATVADLLLARRVRAAIPDLSLTASVLMEISEPMQCFALEGVCDTIVPASRIVRDLPSLRRVRDAFRGRIRLLVNESCVPGCQFRVQHFHEMANGVVRPRSLCAEMLAERPWLRLTGGWVLPQFLHFYAGVYDELKLAGRITLRDPESYLRVLRAYVGRLPLRLNEIGGGPSSVLEPIEMSEDLFEYTLTCGRRCHECTRCPDFYEAAVAGVPSRVLPQLTNW